MSDPNDNLGVGGGLQPPLGGGSSLDEDEKALKKGNTGALVIGLLAAVTLVVALGFVLLQGDGGDNQYGTIGSQINGMRQEHFDQFWHCALPNHPADRLRTNADVRDAIQKRASSRPTQYAAHVRGQCLQKLAEHEPRVRELIAPEDLQGQLEELTTAIGDLRTGWNEYLTYLEQNTSEGYDEAAAAESIGKIAKGWYDYKHAHSGLNTSIREHLDE